MKTAIKVTKMELVAPSQETFHDCLVFMASKGVKLNGFIIRPFSREEFRDHPNVNADCMMVVDSISVSKEVE